MSVRDFLETKRQPTDVYDLLGRPCFDPDREGLASIIRSAYGELLPFQNHSDAKVARRAMQLQLELGRAGELLSHIEKLRAHHRQILDALRTAYLNAKGGAREDWPSERLKSWLQDSESVHSGCLDVVARLVRDGAQPALEAELDKRLGTAPSQDAGERHPPETKPDAEEARLRHRPSVFQARPPEIGPWSEPVASLGGGDVSRPAERSVLEKALHADSQAKTQYQAQTDRNARSSLVRWLGTLALMRISPVVVIGGIVGTIVISAGTVWHLAGRGPEPMARYSPPGSGEYPTDARPTAPKPLPPGFGAPPSPPLWIPPAKEQSSVPSPQPASKDWQGPLLQVRGHDGELHLVLAQVEAFTEDEESVRELLAYRSLEDRPGSADQVKIEGDRVEGGKARFRLRGYLPLVQLTAVERTGDPSSRVEVGKPRPQGRSSGATSAGLAEYLRNHPRSAASVSFDGVFKGFTSPAARVSPAPGDSRTAQIEFAGVPAQAFSDYQRDALVTVEAVVSGKSTPQALVLVGTAICLKDDPTSRITGAGWMTPARDLRKMLDMWRAARSDPESHLQERLEMAGVYGGSSQESGSQSMEIQVGKICGSSEDLKATCPPSAEVSRFLGQLTLGERVLFEAVVVGGRRHRPRIGLLWIARWSQQDQRVRFFPENDAPGIPGAELRCFGETTQEVRLVAWSADGSLLAGAREDGTVSVWEAETGKLVRSFSSQDPTSGSAKTAVYDLAWRPESKELAAVVGESVNAVRRRNPLGAGKQSGAAEAEAVVVWDLTQDPQAPQEPSTFPCPGIRSLSWSPDGTRLAVAGGTDAFVLRVLDLEKGKFSSLSPPKTQGAGFAVAWSPNGSCVAAAHRRPGMVSIWDVAKPRRVGVLPPERAQPTQKPQEKKTRDPRAVTGSRRSGQRPGRSPSSSTPLPVPSYPGVLDRSRLTNLPEIEFPYDSGPRAVAWSPDSSRLAIASRKNLEVWDVPATDQEDPAQKIENERLGFRSYEDLRAVVWSPDGSRLAASAQSSYNLVLLEVDTAEAELVLESGGRVNDLAFSPDGARLATAHGDGKIRVWSTPIKKPRAEEQ